MIPSWSAMASVVERRGDVLMPSRAFDDSL